MLLAGVQFGVSLLAFCAWLSVGRWAFLTPLDLLIVLLQAMLPLVGISTLASAFIRRRYLPLQAMARIGLVIVVGYPIWLLGWWMSVGCVYLIANAGIGVDALNNSQQFVSSFAANLFLPAAAAMLASVVRTAAMAFPHLIE